MTAGFNSRPKEWSRPPEPHPPDAGCWCSRDKRRPYVSLIWCSTTSGHGNGLRPWIRNNNRRTAHELLNLTLDLDHAHVSWHSLDRRRGHQQGNLAVCLERSGVSSGCGCHGRRCAYTAKLDTLCLVIADWQLPDQAVWKRREIAVLPDSAWGKVALESRSLGFRSCGMHRFIHGEERMQQALLPHSLEDYVSEE